MFKKLFGKKELPIEKLEKEHDLSFPKAFKKFISENKPLLFHLPDEDYAVLKSLYTENIDSKLDDFNDLIRHLNQWTNHDDVRTIPFARNKKAGKDKYLVFQEHSNKIFLTDNNGIIQQLELTNIVNLYKANTKLISSEINGIELPTGISYWKDSYQDTVIEGDTRNDSFFVETHGSFYKTKSELESIARIEVQCTLMVNKKTIFFTSAYEIPNPKLESAMKHMLEYRLYYYNLYGLIDCINRFLNKNLEYKTILDNYNLYDVIKNATKSYQKTKLK